MTNPMKGRVVSVGIFRAVLHLLCLVFKWTVAGIWDILVILTEGLRDTETGTAPKKIPKRESEGISVARAD
jgi:hypothetical protein